MTTPKKILRLIRRAFRVQYRLSVLYHGDCWYRNTYGSNGRLLRRMARNSNNAKHWTLYKSGPLFLPEREVDSDDAKGVSR